MARVVALGGDGRDTARAARRGLRAVGQAVIVAPFPIGSDSDTPAGLRTEFAGLAEGERDVLRVDRDVAASLMSKRMTAPPLHITEQGRLCSGNLSGS